MPYVALCMQAFYFWLIASELWVSMSVCVCVCPHGYIDAILWKAIEQWDFVLTIKQTLHYGSSDNKYIV